MTNTRLLKSYIIKNGLTQKELAKIVGISFACLNAKINNKKDFKSKEIYKICEILNIKDIDNVFFA